MHNGVDDMMPVRGFRSHRRVQPHRKSSFLILPGCEEGADLGSSNFG